MASRLTRTVAFRVHEDFAREREAEAAAVGMKLGDYLRRRFYAAFSFAPNAHISSENARGRGPTEITWREANDDDE